jgi:hypothetical protein
MENLVQLFKSEVVIMQELREETVGLIHITNYVKAMKNLIEVHEIISLNLTIHQEYKDFRNKPVWDHSALKDLKSNWLEVLVFYHDSFNPKQYLFSYGKKMDKLFHIINRRNNYAAIDAS